jgi:hypothetical protein
MKTHLLDLIELPTLQRRLIQLLLRRGTLLESELWRLSHMLPEGENLTPAQFDLMLETLERAGWMIRYVDGDETRWRVRFAQKTIRSDAPIWERLSLENIRQQWNVRLPAAGERTASEQTSNETLKEDLLMRRGGKRTLSQAIWDKLEDEPTPANSTETKSRVDGLLNALDKPKDKSTSDKKEIRKRLWDALADDE